MEAQSASRLEDDGYMTIEFDSVERQLDVYAASERLFLILKQTKEKTGAEYLDAVRNYMIELGYPACSDRLADRWAQTVIARYRELKKKDGDLGSPASPASTASTPSV